MLEGTSDGSMDVMDVPKTTATKTKTMMLFVSVRKRDFFLRETEITRYMTANWKWADLPLYLCHATCFAFPDIPQVALEPLNKSVDRVSVVSPESCMSLFPKLILSFWHKSQSLLLDTRCLAYSWEHFGQKEGSPRFLQAYESCFWASNATHL